MPKSDTRFSSKWLEKQDASKKPCSRWLKAGKNESTFLCTVCNEEKSCKNGGWSDVFKHSERPKHLQRLKDVIESSQLIGRSAPTTASSSFLTVTTTNDRALTQDEKVTRAEAYWAMATAKLSLSYNASQYMQELFSHMFSDSHIAKEFSMKPRKLSYILSHGTGHYFTNAMVRDLIKAPGFTLIFDETTVVGVRKQLDLHVRYWCEKKQGIVVRYYKSIFLGHATANIVFRNIVDTLRADGIDLTRMLMLGRDNPSVNIAIEAMMDKEIRAEREKRYSSTPKSDIGLIDIGSCPLHLVHNSFRVGIANTDWAIDEFLNDLFFWFSRSAARREDYVKVTTSISDGVAKFMRRFVVTRWLEAGPVVERVIEQWTNVHQYFLCFLPTTDRMAVRSERYIQIKTVLEKQSILLRLNFIVFVYRHIFHDMLVWFQQSQPLVHLLSDECDQLLRRLLSCFIREDLIQNKNIKELMAIAVEDEANQKSDAELDIGEAARNASSNVSSAENQTFFSDVRNIYRMISQEQIRTLPLDNDLLRHLRCLQPLMRQTDSARVSVMNVARSLPQMLAPDDIDRVGAEWRVYESEIIPNDWIETKTGIDGRSTEYVPIDVYWRKVLSMKTSTGADKFVALAKLVKCALALSHGNADVERGFSENALLLTDDRSLLSDISINGLRATRDGVKFFGDGKPHEVPITKGLLDSVRDAHSRYRIDLERQQELLKKEAASKAATANENDVLLIEKESNLFDEQKALHVSLANVQKMLDEGAERLAAAIAKKNFVEIETAQLLIEGGNKKLAATNVQIVTNNNKLNQLRKKQKK